MDETTLAMYRLVREVRHDLNGPLTSILGNVQMLLEDPGLHEDVRETLHEVEDDLRRLSTMVRRLSDVHHPDESA